MAMSDFEILVTIAIGEIMGFWFIATTCCFLLVTV